MTLEEAKKTYAVGSIVRHVDYSSVLAVVISAPFRRTCHFTYLKFLTELEAANPSNLSMIVRFLDMADNIDFQVPVSSYLPMSEEELAFQILGSD